eukprot:2497397-Rhodomonas_salina.2
MPLAATPADRSVHPAMLLLSTSLLLPSPSVPRLATAEALDVAEVGQDEVLGGDVAGARGWTWLALSTHSSPESPAAHRARAHTPNLSAKAHACDEPRHAVRLFQLEGIDEGAAFRVRKDKQRARLREVGGGYC